MVLDLYFDVDRKQRVAGLANGSIVAMPSFSQANAQTFRIRALQPTGILTTPYTFVPNAGKTLQFALGKKQSTDLHYVEQYTWALGPDAADPYFEADVNFNTAGIATLLGAAASATTYLEVNIVDNGKFKTIFSQQVTVEASVIHNGVLTVPVGQTAISMETALGLFLQRQIVGKVTLVNDTDPTKSRELYVDTDGTFHEDPA